MKKLLLKKFVAFVAVGFLLFISNGYAQVDKGVTSTGKEVDCSTIDPSVDKTVSEYGAIVTQPRLTRNGKLITDDCGCPVSIDCTQCTDTVNCISITMSAPILSGDVTSAVLQIFSDAGYTTQVGSDITATISDGKITAVAANLNCYTKYYLRLKLNNNSNCVFEWTDSTRDATLEKAMFCTVANIRTDAVSETDRSHEHLVEGSTTEIDSVYDHEGNAYAVVQIGTGANAQCWLKENMRAKTSPSTHSQIVMNPMVQSCSSKSAGYYENNESQYGKYGVLYNWCAAVDTFYAAGSQPELANASGHSSTDWTVSMPAGNRRGICPAGWHVPTDAEWSTLATNAGVGQGSGTGLGKLTGGCDWYSEDIEGQSYPGTYSYTDRNATGFSALPAGYYYSNFSNVRYTAYFWSATPSGNRNYIRSFNYSDQCVIRSDNPRYNGYSVRCLRDNTGVTLGEVTKTDSTANTLSISADYTATKTVTSATICAYTNEECTEPATPICATGSDVTIGESAITGTIEGLEPSTQYYVKVSVTTEGGTESKVGGPFGTKALTLTLTSNPASATVKLCGQSSVTVTYTANLEGGTAETYSWSTSGGSATTTTSNTYTVTYTAANTYTVTCTAAGVSATKVVTIASGGTAATLVLCEDCNAGSITVKYGNCTSLTWVNNDDPTKTDTTVGTVGTVLSESASTPAGVYTVTGTNSSGCTVTRTATLGKATAHPCTVTSLRAGTALDGGKYANREYGTGTQLDSVSDHEGNVYRVVQIGEGANAQCWLKENMRATTSPSTHSTILMVPMVQSYSSKSACYYYNSETYGRKYGVLYNWCAAVDTFYNDGQASHPELANASGHNSTNWYVTLPAGPRRGICPAGWHVPTIYEWDTLATNAGVGQSSGTTGVGKLAGGCDWDSSSARATSALNYAYSERNSAGFSALPAGFNHGSGFGNVRLVTYFWSSNPSVSSYAYYQYIDYMYEYLARGQGDRRPGYSVRCVRDN